MAEEYVSGEEYKEMTAGSPRKNKPAKKGMQPIQPKFAIVIGIVILLLGFLGGVAYQKSNQPKAATALGAGFGSTGSSSGFQGRRFGGQRPTIGQVTAVSDSSITIQDEMSGSATTLSITSNTQITNNGQTVTASSIQTGDRVLIVASTSDKTQAARIMVNPSFGGGASSSSGSSDNSAISQ